MSKFLLTFFFLSHTWSSGLSVRQWPGRPGFNPRSRHTKDLKLVHDISLLKTQHYKACIKGKVEQSGGRSSALPLHLGVVAIEKGAFGSSSIMVVNFIYFISQVLER